MPLQAGRIRASLHVPPRKRFHSMAFTTKTKTLSRLASANKLFHKDKVGFGAILNGDSVLLALQQDMVTQMGAIKHHFVGSGEGNIQAPLPFPCPTARWMGRFSMDTTTKGQNAHGKTVYTYDHQKAFTANAEAFRNRVQEITDYYRMENDLTNADKHPNPGGVSGAHFKAAGAGA